MALAARVTDAKTVVPAKDAEGGDITIDLGLQGQVFIAVEFFDDTKPATVLATATFQGPDRASLVQQVVAFGQRMRTARSAETQFKALIGQTIAIP